MSEIASALRCVDLPHDIGEQGVEWFPDDDPECAPVDSWARGAIPLKVKKKSFLSDIRDNEHATGTASVGSHARSRRTKSARRSKKVDNNSQGPATPAIIMSASDSSSSRPSKLPAKAALLQEHEENDKLNELELLQQREEERIAQLRKEQEDEDARYKALQEELHGKEYTFTSDGDLIMISKMSAEKKGVFLSGLIFVGGYNAYLIFVYLTMYFRFYMITICVLLSNYNNKLLVYAYIINFAFLNLSYYNSNTLRWFDASFCCGPL